MEQKDTTTFEVHLSEEHRRYLNGCGISDAVIDARPYYSLDDTVREYLTEDWGFAKAQVEGSGIVIPRYRPNGEETFPQVRHDEPRTDENGESRKYDSPKRSGGVLDFHPMASFRGLVNEVEIPLWHPESPKSADALLSRGHLAVGFQGVWGWSRDRRPADDWEKIPLAGRENFIAFDSDVHVRSDLKRALKRFVDYLRYERHAVVYIVRIPQPSDEKVGVDDHYAALADAADAADAVFKKNYFVAGEVDSRHARSHRWYGCILG